VRSADLALTAWGNGPVILLGLICIFFDVSTLLGASYLFR